MAQIPYGFARKAGVVILGEPALGVRLRLGLCEGADPTALTEVRRILGQGFEIEPLSSERFERCLSDAYAGEGLTPSGQDDFGGDLHSLTDDLPAAQDLLEAKDDAPIIRLINGLLSEAMRLQASDIHIEPYEQNLLIRVRIDGILREILRLNVRIAPLLVSRVKVMARLDIAEKRIPQDGRMSLTFGGRNLDVRVSTLPSKAGERVVMRLLSRDASGLRLEALGMPPKVLDAFHSALKQPNGIILITGPTGSGKTTSLYAGLSVLNDTTRNILTIEDPVEYAIDGIGQTQVNTKVGMTFAAGLRAILRQDPDVVMVGEIRDSETAQIAVQAALTGHLVLSTVHTNDAVGALTRLRDMGVEPFLLASTIKVIAAQRLVRKLCQHCRRSETIDKTTAKALNLSPTTQIFRPVGCDQCNHTGFNGRIGVYEIVTIDDTVRRLISEGASESAITQHVFSQGGTLSDYGRDYVTQGVTTFEEILRVTRQDQEGLSHAEL
jgi:general secretion pathway protein E